MSKFCTSCGAKNPDEAKFCKNCGNELINDESQEIEKKETVDKSDADDINTSNQNHKEMSFSEFYFSGVGRIGRQEFFTRGFIPLTALLFLNGAIFKILNILVLKGSIDYSMIQTMNFINIVIYIIIMYSITVVSIKRFHDYNSSGWNSMLLFIPLINLIVTLFLIFKGSVNKENQYNQIISTYKMTGIKWFLFILKLILLLVSMMVFSFVNVSEQKSYKEESSTSFPNMIEKNSKISKTSNKKKYSLTVKTIPADANIYITNIKPKYYDGILLKRGLYNIKVKRKGFQTIQKKIEFSDNLVITIKLRKKYSNVVSIDNLMWQDNIDVKTEKVTWNEANNYCNNLNLESFNDWRLPTIQELTSIIDKSTPSLIKSEFQNYAMFDYWSSSSTSDYKVGAQTLAIFKDDIMIDNIHKDNNAHVRCVRDRY